MYRTTKDVRFRTRAHIILLAAEQGMSAPTIAPIVRENDQTVRNWLTRYSAEGIEGLHDAPRLGAPKKVTPAYVTQLLNVVRLRPRSLGLPYSLWTLARLADSMAEQTGMSRRSGNGPAASARGRHCFQSSPTHNQQSCPRIPGKKKTIETTRDGLKPGEVFYSADACNLSWLPTRKAMGSPTGQQVMIPTPGQPTKRSGIGAVNDHTGETVVLCTPHKRRREIAALLHALLEQHPTETVSVAWDNATTHEDDDVEAVVRSAAGRLILLYLPTYSPWLNPMEMLWRHFRREVTHGELFESVKALVAAAQDFFARYNRCPDAYPVDYRGYPKRFICLYLSLFLNHYRIRITWRLFSL